MNRIGVFIVVCFLCSCSGKKIENIAIHSISEAYIKQRKNGWFRHPSIILMQKIVLSWEISRLIRHS